METAPTDPAPIRIDGPGPYYAVYFPAERQQQQQQEEHPE